MENPGDLKFEVGQLAEIKTFLEGFRGAWFRCKIKDIDLKNNKIMPEYFDFPEEEIAWTEIYELPHYSKKSKLIKKQLMVRPQYPQIYQKSEMPAVNSISKVHVIINGEWKVDDLVDWYKDDCYWSARVIEILTDDKVKVELPMPPAGQGGIYEAFCKDLRPNLNWSPIEGWTFPTMNGQTSCNAQLIFPSQQGMDIKRDENEIVSPQSASSTSQISQLPSPTLIKEPSHNNSQEMKMEVDIEKASSSDSISTTQVEKSKIKEETWKDVDYNTTLNLNINHQESLEASILDLEELANRIKWLRSFLDNNNHLTSPLWKFEGHC